MQARTRAWVTATTRSALLTPNAPARWVARKALFCLSSGSADDECGGLAEMEAAFRVLDSELVRSECMDNQLEVIDDLWRAIKMMYLRPHAPPQRTNKCRPQRMLPPAMELRTQRARWMHAAAPSHTTTPLLPEPVQKGTAVRRVWRQSPLASSQEFRTKTQHAYTPKC